MTDRKSVVNIKPAVTGNAPAVAGGAVANASVGQNPGGHFLANGLVVCDGGAYAGHPRIFLRLGKEPVVCPYCSNVFHQHA